MTTEYSCKKCRKVLFNISDLSEHESGKHRFARRKAKKGSSGGACDSYFLAAPTDWMASVAEEVEGKLLCPKCSARLGSLKWAGTQCSCGTWVTPAIQIPKGRVDERVPYTPALVGAQITYPDLIAPAPAPVIPPSATVTGVEETKAED